jgi:hypothetical protein
MMALKQDVVLAGHTGLAVLRASPASDSGYFTAAGLALMVADPPHRQRFFRAHDAPITALDVSFNAELIATGQDACPAAPGGDAPVIVWRAPAMTQEFHFLGLTRRVAFLAFSPDGEGLCRH